MEREGAEVPVPRPTLEARASAYGPEDPMLPGVPNGTPGSNNPKQTTAWEADIQTRPQSAPFENRRGRARAKRVSGGMPGVSSPRRCHYHILIRVSRTYHPGVREHI